MTHVLYNIAVTVLFAAISPFFLSKFLLREKGIHQERWASYSHEILRKIEGRPLVWFHAASVGEARVVLPLLEALRNLYPSHRFLVSTATPQGREIASQFPGVDVAILAPLDLPWVVSRAVKTIAPSVFLVAETELWPNLLRAMKRDGVPTMLFNGRISRRSYRMYRLLRFFFKDVLKNFDALCVRSAPDRDRLLSLGAEPETTHVVGDLKFHQMGNVSRVRRQREELKATLQLPEKSPILIAGSTHEGEEEIVLQVYKDLKLNFPGLVLILAPRHVQRFSRVEALLKSQGVGWVRRSKIGTEAGSKEVVLLDSIGELAAVYGLGTAIFVGGSFGKVGGHNIMEVFAQGKGVVFGPDMENFSEIARLAVETGAGIQVTDATELREALRRLLNSPDLQRKMGKAGTAFVALHQGALEKTVEAVKKLLENR